MACRPKKLGGLRILNLCHTSTAVKVCWLSLQRTDMTRSWRILPLVAGADVAILLAGPDVLIE